MTQAKNIHYDFVKTDEFFKFQTSKLYEKRAIKGHWESGVFRGEGGGVGYSRRAGPCLFPVYQGSGKNSGAGWGGGMGGSLQKGKR